MIQGFQSTSATGSSVSTTTDKVEKSFRSVLGENYTPQRHREGLKKQISIFQSPQKKCSRDHSSQGGEIRIERGAPEESRLINERIQWQRKTGNPSDHGGKKTACVEVKTSDLQMQAKPGCEQPCK